MRMWKIRRKLIKLNPFIGKQLKKERIWNLREHIKEVPNHDIPEKYKNKKNVVVYSLSPSITVDNRYHSFVVYKRGKK